MKAIGTTRQAAQDFGFVRDDGRPNVAAFKKWVADKGIKPENYNPPKPGMPWRQHHLWWNYSEIKNAFDKKVITKTDSGGWNKKISEALGGEDKGGVPDRASL